MSAESLSAWRSFNPRRDLATRFGLLGFGSSLALSLVLAAVVGAAVRPALEERLRWELENNAVRAARGFDEFLSERFRALQSIAAADALTSPSATVEQRRRVLDDLVAAGQAAWVGFADTSGVVIAGSDQLLEGSTVAARDWFRAGSTAPYRGSPQPNEQLAAAAGVSARIIDYGLPVRDAGGRLLGVLGVMDFWTIPIARYGLPPDFRAQEIVASIYRRPPVGLWLLDSRNSSESRRLLVPLTRGAPRGNLRQVESGQSFLVGFANNSAADFPVVVAVRQPADVAFAPARQIRIRILQWGFAVSALLAILPYLAGRRITRKLRAMAISADRISSGDPLSIMPEFQTSDQLAKAADSVAKLVEKLKADSAPKAERAREQPP